MSTANLHFQGLFNNIRDVRAALGQLRDGGYERLVEEESELIGEIFESAFEHQKFTGRSGTFYGYEGLGSIYWHMVSKLLLAVQRMLFGGRRPQRRIVSRAGRSLTMTFVRVSDSTSRRRCTVHSRRTRIRTRRASPAPNSPA